MAVSCQPGGQGRMALPVVVVAGAGRVTRFPRGGSTCSEISTQRRIRGIVMAQLRILIVDDNQAVREGLKALIGAQPDWQIVGEAVGGQEGIEKAAQLQPDVVILDYSLPELDGLSAATRIREAAPAAELLVFSQHDAPFTVRRALAAGIRGYVLKSDAGTDLLRAIEAVREHREFLSSTIAQYFHRGRRPASRA